MVLRNSHGNLTGDKVYRETVERHGRQTEKKLGCGEGDKRRQSSACSCRTPPQLCHDQSLGGGPSLDTASQSPRTHQTPLQAHRSEPGRGLSLLPGGEQPPRAGATSHPRAAERPQDPAGTGGAPSPNSHLGRLLLSPWG